MVSTGRFAVSVPVVFVALLGAVSGCGGGGDVGREVGARCELRHDCDDRCLAPGEAFPDGFCTVTCAAHDDCPNRAACTDAEGGVCLFNCRDDESCAFLGEGWRCHTMPGMQGDEVTVCMGDES